MEREARFIMECGGNEFIHVSYLESVSVSVAVFGVWLLVGEEKRKADQH